MAYLKGFIPSWVATVSFFDRLLTPRDILWIIGFPHPEPESNDPKDVPATRYRLRTMTRLTCTSVPETIWMK